MAVAETNKIITHGDGQSIATSIQNIANAINDQEKNVHLSDAQTITGAKTFSSQVTASGGVKTDKVTSTNGTEVLAYDGTTTALKGKATRPTYNGGDLALKSDVSAVNNGIAEYLFANKVFAATSFAVRFPFPSYLWGGTDYIGMYACSYGFNCHIQTLPELPSNVGTQCDIKFATGVTMGNGKDYIDCSGMFFGNPAQTTIYLRSDMFNGIVNADLMFSNSNVAKIDVEGDGIKIRSAAMMFNRTYNLTEIGNFDFSTATEMYQTFWGTKALTALHCTHFKLSFDLQHSVALTESAVVEIFNNLDVVSSTQTVTLAAVVYDLLTTDDLAIANGKGWAVARAS